MLFAAVEFVLVNQIGAFGYPFVFFPAIREYQKDARHVSVDRLTRFSKGGAIVKMRGLVANR
jgi:hypothetical protein